MQVLLGSTGGRRNDAAASDLVKIKTYRCEVAAPTRAELVAIYDAVADVEGWDFRGAEPVPETEPWRWEEEVRAACTPKARVLDIGTGGGEVFREYADAFELGLGVDRSAERIGVASKHTPHRNLRFAVMDGAKLAVRDASLDVVLARCADYSPPEVRRVLRPGGVFITLQMGDHDTQNLFDAFRWGSYGAYWRSLFESNDVPYRTSLDAVADFQDLGCTEIRYEEYGVPQYFQDVASLVLFLKASPPAGALRPGGALRRVCIAGA